MAFLILACIVNSIEIDIEAIAESGFEIVFEQPIDPSSFQEEESQESH